MVKRKFVLQALAAVVLYVGISLILEKEYTNEIILSEVLEGLIFGLLYGIFIWFRERLKKKKE
ncbi:MAG: hypothetical protein DRI70_09555 [Bacteroidetes bacterium]|nr:MAG: hypothetical protein DRI70_09555 [Bacteroidota bacterium]